MATVRENTSGDARTRIEVVNARFSAINMTLRELVSIVYPTEGGRFRHASQLVGGPGWFNSARFDRRLRQGLMAVATYTFSKATDDAAAFTTADLNGGVIAQNWLALDAERAPSSFDQRHLLTTQVEYAGSAFLRNWVFTSQLTVGSGLPSTPLYLTSLAGTGLTGAVRASYTGAPIDAAPPGYYVNPAAFTAPAPGQWGTAGRNSIIGPAQFSLNTGITRTFLLSNRWSMDWRIDATNILNRVTYSGINTIVGSPQFGLPNRANAMRKLLSSLRVRF